MKTDETQDATDHDESHGFDVPVLSASPTAKPPEAAPVDAGTATSNPAQPAASTPQEQPAVEVLPTELKAALELMLEADKMPTRDKFEQAAKDARMKIVRGHWFKLQQGTPVIHVGGDALSSVGRMLTEESQMIHMRNLALVDPVVKEFLAAFVDMRAALSK